MIINKHKAIFVHIPKSAGTSVSHYFHDSSQKKKPGMHDDIHQIKKTYPDLYESYKKFSIVRNPYDKMVSWFFYLKSHEDICIDILQFSDNIKSFYKNRSTSFKKGDSLDFLEFNAWIKDFSVFQIAINKLVDFYEDLASKVALIPSAHKIENISGKRWLGDGNSFLNPQHTWLDDTVKVIKFENINKELSDFFKMEINLPYKNESNHNHYSTYYNEESLDIVYNKYKEDFEKFNYNKI